MYAMGCVGMCVDVMCVALTRFANRLPAALLRLGDDSLRVSARHRHTHVEKGRERDDKLSKDRRDKAFCACQCMPIPPSLSWI